MKMNDNKTKKKNNKIWVAVIALFLVVVVSVACVFCFGKKTDDEDLSNPPESSGQFLGSLFSKPMNVTSKIGVSYKLLGTVNRTKPDVKDEGLSRYPVYGTTLSKTSTETSEDLTNLKKAILSENAFLNADPDGTLSGTCSNYDSMDSQGFLYLEGEPVLDSSGVQRQLYKHTASIGMYFGDVSDDEVAVIKQIKIQPRSMGNCITGLYAPAGELIKLTISAKDLKSVGEFNVYVGSTLANGQANNIWLDRDFVRMPVVANKMPVNENVCSFDEASDAYTCYFGSFLGGPIYIGSPKLKNQFKVEISGAVEYPHFIYGLTTKEEYNRLLKSSAPYFDLEVFDNSVRFSGARKIADKYSFEELCESAELWDKISRVSKQVPTGSNSSYGIDFLFDPFVASGAAVAFVGRNSVNCPYDWMDTCLDVEHFVINGAWGNIHEFNHHYQNFGLPNHGEVTNNAINLVEYSLFTKISSQRSLNDNSLRDWNVFTDPSRALRELLSNTTSGAVIESLDAYANVLHAFGQSVFIASTENGDGVNNWFKNLCNLTHYNFYYYFTELLHESVDQSVADEIAQKNYPMYVPVACIYQTGTKYVFNGQLEHITTVQPFEFSGESYNFKVEEMLIIPEGFTVKSVAVGNSQYGNVEKIGDDLFKFTPSSENISGNIDVTIKLSKDDEEFDVEDVRLVFGFKQQQKRIAERTTYYFDDEILEIFEDVDDAVQKGFEGYSSSAKFDSTFNGDECAEVWWNSEGVVENAITEYNSKIYIKEGNTYRFSIRGKYANLYVSLDGENYELVARADSTYSNNFNEYVEKGEYQDFALGKGQIVFIKAVVMHVDVSRCSFVVGMAVSNDGKFNLDRMINKIEVYNINYQKEKFESDYFYPREYQISEFAFSTNPTSSVVSTNFEPWDETTKLENMFDGNLSTFMHNKEGCHISESNPFEIVVDLGKTICANKITMFGRSRNTQTPKTYKLFGGMSLDEMSLLCEYEDEGLKNTYHQIGRFEMAEFRYYKLVVTKTSARYICLAGIEFSVEMQDGKLFSPDVENVNYYGDWEVNHDLAMFGHSYISESGCLEFTFSGTQFAVLSKLNLSSSFTVSIDGSEEVLLNFGGASELMFLSEVLENKTHRVIIRSITGIDIVAFVTK